MSQGSVVTPISIYLLGSGHHCPPFECSSSCWQQSWVPTPLVGTEGGSPSSQLSSGSSHPPHRHCPTRGDSADGAQEGGGLPHWCTPQHPMPPTSPHGAPLLQPEQCQKKKEDVQRSAVDVLVPSVCCNRKKGSVVLKMKQKGKIRLLKSNPCRNYLVIMISFIMVLYP